MQRPLAGITLGLFRSGGGKCVVRHDGVSDPNDCYSFRLRKRKANPLLGKGTNPLNVGPRDAKKR
jgi:hypothetical protein